MKSKDDLSAGLKAWLHLEWTLKGVEDGEAVVGGHEQRSTAEECKSPGDPEQKDPAYDGERLCLGGADVLPVAALSRRMRRR